MSDFNLAVLADPQRARSLALIAYVARRPKFCCGCICLDLEDRRRAWRVFRIVRREIRAWESAAKAKTAQSAGIRQLVRVETHRLIRLNAPLIRSASNRSHGPRCAPNGRSRPWVTADKSRRERYSRTRSTLRCGFLFFGMPTNKAGARVHPGPLHVCSIARRDGSS